jgi:hypothetical protein
MNDNSREKPLISIIIVNYNGIAHTRQAVLSVLRHSLNSEIIVVDNCSTDDSVEALRNEFSSLIVLSLNENRGFGYGCNRGAEGAKGKYLFFLNNDTLLSEDTPAILASFLEKNPTVAACGPRLLNPDGTFQLSFGLDPSLANEWIVRRWQHPRKSAREETMSSLERRYANAKVDWVSGAALMMRKGVFQKLNGFDESFFMYFEDVDLCRRIRDTSFSVLYVNMTSVTHLLGQSAKDGTSAINLDYRRSQIHYYRKHRSSVALLLLRLYLALRPFIQRT